MPRKSDRETDAVHRLRRKVKAQSAEIMALHALVDCMTKDRLEALLMVKRLAGHLEGEWSVPE
jgi:hypothetical protein